MARGSGVTTPQVKKVDSEGNVHVQWMKPGAQRASRVSVEGKVIKSGSWWARVGKGGKKEKGFKTRKAAAEWIIQQISSNGSAVPTATLPAQKRGRGEYGFTAEDIVRERDENNQSWKQVAQALGLKTPGAARTAYSALTGKHHSTSVMAGRTVRASGGVMVTGEDLTARWDADTRREVVEEVLRCKTCEGRGWKPDEQGGTKRCDDGVTIRRFLWLDDNFKLQSGPPPKDAHGVREEVLKVRCVHKWYPPNSDGNQSGVPAVGMTNVMTGGGHVWRLTDFLN